jgi:hypothetical protein
MRRGWAAAWLGVAMGGSLVACFDLLHGTSDVLTACELDGGTPGCVARPSDGGAPASPAADFCAMTSNQAEDSALHACAWLGACASPLTDDVAFGPCYFRALTAFDCAISPSCRALGAAHDAWDCLRRAVSCDDVRACGSLGAGVPADDDASPFPLAAMLAAPACRPVEDAEACVPDATASCENGRAVSCPSGVVETVDCAALLGSPTACSPGPLGTPSDSTSACRLAACGDDSCAGDGSILESCAGGAVYQANCARAGLGPCRLVAMGAGSTAQAPRAACTPRP